MLVRKVLAGFAVCLFLAAPALPRAAQRKPLTVGLMLRLGNTQDAQFKALFGETVQHLSRRLSIQTKAVYFTRLADFQQALKNKNLDLAMYLDDIGSHQDYHPFMAYTLYSEKVARNCLYIHKKNNAVNYQALRGKRLMMQPKPYLYFTMRNTFPMRPESFYSSIQGSSSAFSGFYALSLEQVDALYATRMEYLHLKATNKGSVKNIKILECDPSGLPFPPLILKVGLDNGLTAKLEKILLDLHNDKTFKMQMVMDLTQMRFIKIGEGYTNPLEALKKKAKEKHWDKDFQVFQNMVKMGGG